MVSGLNFRLRCNWAHFLQWRFPLMGDLGFRHSLHGSESIGVAHFRWQSSLEERA